MGAAFTETITSQTMNLDLTQTMGARTDLTGLCTDLFLIVIKMREAEDLGDPASLRKLTLYYLELFEKNCSAIKIQPSDTENARYALVALLDETVLSTAGACRDFWLSRPLQLDLFGDNVAGQIFYEKLESLLQNADQNLQVLNVYYLCLSLGFEGKYKIIDGHLRQELIEKLGNILRRGLIRSSSGLSPHGIRNEFRRSKKIKIKSRPLWLPILIAVIGSVASWGVFKFLSMQLPASIIAAASNLIG